MRFVYLELTGNGAPVEYYLCMEHSKDAFTQSVLRGIIHVRLGRLRIKNFFSVNKRPFYENNEITKINEKRPGLAHFFKKTNDHFTRRNLPLCERYMSFVDLISVDIDTYPYTTH